MTPCTGYKNSHLQMSQQSKLIPIQFEKHRTKENLLVWINHSLLHSCRISQLSLPMPDRFCASHTHLSLRCSNYGLCVLTDICSPKFWRSESPRQRCQQTQSLAGRLQALPACRHIPTRCILTAPLVGPDYLSKSPTLMPCHQTRDQCFNIWNL